jgi:hypothetical protein
MSHGAFAARNQNITCHMALSSHMGQLDSTCTAPTVHQLPARLLLRLLVAGTKLHLKTQTLKPGDHLIR